MKHFILLTLGLTLSIGIHAQTFSEKVAIESCNCLDSLETFKQLEDNINNCITKAMVLVSDMISSKEMEFMNTVEGIQGVYREVNEILPSYCYNVRRLIIEEREREFYKDSSFPTANNHYDKGNEFMDDGNYAEAAKEFKKAIKIDNKFVYAYDHLAISYRRQDKYKEAIKYYQKSLNIFPEGNLALLNIAVAYSYLKDYNNSLKYYNSLIFLHQKSPEGYFGAGRMLFIMGDYEAALDNIFIAHLMYIETDSDYVKDSEQMIGIMYSELKGQGKVDLFFEKAKKYNININIDQAD